MAINRNSYNGDLAVGKRIKVTTVSALDSVTEASQLVADTVTTARSTMELIHGSLQEPIAEQKIATQKTIVNGIKELVALGMDEAEAKAYLLS